MRCDSAARGRSAPDDPRAPRAPRARPAGGRVALDSGGRAAAARPAEGAAWGGLAAPERPDFARRAPAGGGRGRVAIPPAGAAPALAAKLRAAFERDLDAAFRAFVDRLAAERDRLRREEPD